MNIKRNVETASHHYSQHTFNHSAISIQQQGNRIALPDTL